MSVIFSSPLAKPGLVPGAGMRGSWAALGDDAFIPPPAPSSPGSGWAVSEKLFEESLESPLIIPDSCQN